MGAYRLYFLDEGGRIAAAEIFDAAQDSDAATLAELLADACSDRCHGFELWQRERRVARQKPLNASNHRAAITEAMQRSLVERLEHIRDSRWRISESRKLLARIDEARRMIPRKGGGVG